VNPSPTGHDPLAALSQLPADGIIETYLRACENEYKQPRVGDAMQLLIKAKRLGLMAAKRHVDAFVLDHPGTFGRYKPSDAKKTWLWIAVDTSLAALVFYWAWGDWSRNQGFPIFTAIIGVWILWSIKHKVEWLRFLTKRGEGA
jgi:hypothetical protein